MYGVERAPMREVFFRAWRNYRLGLPAEGVERLVIEVALKHPEYHKLLEAPERHAERDFSAAAGESNPFLHLGMHIAIEEQVAIDQPRGVQSHYRRLQLLLTDAHAAQHAMMECLGEMLVQAPRERSALAETRYLDCLAQRARVR